MDLAIFNRQGTASIIGDADAQATVLEAAGNARVGTRLVGLLDGFQTFCQAAALVDNLAVGQDIPGPDHIEITEIPRVHAAFVCQEVEVALHGITGLSDPEAPEGAGDHIVGVDGLARNIDILEIVGSPGVGAGPLGDRAPREA